MAETIWVVINYDYDTCEVEGVFSSEANAKQYLARIQATDGHSIKQMVIDSELQRIAVHPIISAEFHQIEVLPAENRIGRVCLSWRNSLEPGFVGEENSYGFSVFVRADLHSREQAEGIAMEKMRQYQRLQTEQPDLRDSQILTRLK